MSEGATTALIAAGSAILGGLLAAFATRSVEKLRLRAALNEKAEDRKLNAIQRFAQTSIAWFEYVQTINKTWPIWRELYPTEKERVDAELDAAREENNRRSREKQDAYRELVLLASEDLHRWLVDKYEPLEQEVRRDYVEPVLDGVQLPEEVSKLRKQYNRMLHREMIDRFRPELTNLREPTQSVGWRAMMRGTR